MKTLALRLLNEADGQDLIEYALLAALVALAATVGMTALGQGINEKFSAVSTTLAS
ncbi:MAG: Flp family type IVb pilin [Vicinamibacterales bacterium]